MQRQGQTETDQERILDARFFMSFDDKLKQSPIESESEREHGRANGCERHKRINLPKSEKPKSAVAAEHEQFAVGHVQNAEHAEGERESCRGQTVKAADQKTENKLLSENHCQSENGPSAIMRG